METPLPAGRAPRDEKPPVPAARPKAKQRPGGGGTKVKGAEAPLAEKLRDGTLLCRNFNLGSCTRKGCSYKHQCSKILNGGRVCGAKHAAKDHR